MGRSKFSRKFKEGTTNARARGERMLTRRRKKWLVYGGLAVGGLWLLNMAGVL